VTTLRGRQYVIRKLHGARNLSELAAVWATIGKSYRREPEIFGLKETLKRQMEKRA